MSKNQAQFQKGYSLADFSKTMGPKTNVPKSCLNFVGRMGSVAYG